MAGYGDKCNRLNYETGRRLHSEPDFDLASSEGVCPNGFPRHRRGWVWLLRWRRSLSLLLRCAFRPGCKATLHRTGCSHCPH